MAKVAVIFGGMSNEHGVSCVSGAAVIEALRRSGHDVVGIGITLAGTWHEVAQMPHYALGATLPEFVATSPEVTLSLDPSRKGFVRSDGSLLSAEVVFPVLHGPYGEDGTVQGALELAHIPYVGSGVLASAMSMDKITMKYMLEAHQLPVGPWGEIPAHSDGVAEVSTMGFPAFIKPARAGSSRGISRVTSLADVPEALAAARAVDPRVLVERAIINAREIECGVLQMPDGSVRTSVCAEIVVHPDFDFYDFDAKYVSDGADLKVPASFEQEVEVREFAQRTFLALGAEGLARVDFFVDAAGGVIVNEINTMPGFTQISMYPRMWEATGIPYAELVDTLVRSALARPQGLR